MVLCVPRGITITDKVGIAQAESRSADTTVDTTVEATLAGTTVATPGTPRGSARRIRRTTCRSNCSNRKWQCNRNLSNSLLLPVCNRSSNSLPRSRFSRFRNSRNSSLSRNNRRQSPRRNSRPRNRLAHRSNRFRSSRWPRDSRCSRNNRSPPLLPAPRREMVESLRLAPKRRDLSAGRPTRRGRRHRPTFSHDGLLRQR